MCECCRRLLALLRMIERSAAPFGALGDDAALDAWFGPRSPLFGPTTHRADLNTDGYP
jgi:hypothetical protein